MPYSLHTDPVIHKLITWGEQREAVRAMLITSTRAIPNGKVDRYSDYDVVLVLSNIHPFVEDKSWLGDFGDVLVVYWDSIFSSPEYGMEQSGNVTQYTDGLKIDFSLWPVAMLQRVLEEPTLPAELDAGYAVLLDKDGITAALQAPTYKSYIPARPTNELYQTTIQDFFSDVPYVAKCLWRDELLPAKWCLDTDMKHLYLVRMLEWRAEIDHGWSLKTGVLGKGLKRHLPADLWQQLEQTYVGPGIEENWNALFATVALFRRAALDVAADLDYAYPHDLDQGVTKYAEKMRQTT